MKPSNSRIITLAQAIDEFNIAALCASDLADPLTDKFDEEEEVLVFDGDTGFTGNIDIARGIAFGEAYDYQNHPIIIVKGNLKAGSIHMWRVDGLFVFGNLECEKVHFQESYPLYVQGNLTAHKAILATAEQEGPFLGHEEFCKSFVFIHGEVTAPYVHTWFFPLSCLNWASGSGKEIPEDKDYPRDKWTVDPVWKF